MRKTDIEKYEKAKEIFEKFENPTKLQKKLFEICKGSYEWLRENDNCSDDSPGRDTA